MLERLELANVGPAPAMTLELAPRINLITGDNGLGKSFLLDVAWWALTRKWPRDLNPSLTAGFMARPTNVREPATLRFTIRTAAGGSRSYASVYSALQEGWPGPPQRPYGEALVVYAHVDGGFSVWDPARNFWHGSLRADRGRRGESRPVTGRSRRRYGQHRLPAHRR